MCATAQMRSCSNGPGISRYLGPEAANLTAFRLDAQADGPFPGRFREREDHAPHVGRSLGQVHVFDGFDPRHYHFGVEVDAQGTTDPA